MDNALIRLLSFFGTRELYRFVSIPSPLLCSFFPLTSSYYVPYTSHLQISTQASVFSLYDPVRFPDLSHIPRVSAINLLHVPPVFVVRALCASRRYTALGMYLSCFISKYEVMSEGKRKELDYNDEIKSKVGVGKPNETGENEEDGEKIIKKNSYLHFIYVILELFKLILIGKLKEKDEKEGKLGEWRMDCEKRDQENLDERLDEDMGDDMVYVFANKKGDVIKNMIEINEEKIKKNSSKLFNVLLADDDLEAFDDFLVNDRSFLSTFIRNKDDIEYERKVEIDKKKKVLIEKYKEQQKDKVGSEQFNYVMGDVSSKKEVYFLT
jgi:hypothetical protein